MHYGKSHKRVKGFYVLVSPPLLCLNAPPCENNPHSNVCSLLKHHQMSVNDSEVQPSVSVKTRHPSLSTDRDWKLNSSKSRKPLIRQRSHDEPSDGRHSVTTFIHIVAEGWHHAATEVTPQVFKDACAVFLPPPIAFISSPAALVCIHHLRLFICAVSLLITSFFHLLSNDL